MVQKIKRFGWKPDLPDQRDHLFLEVMPPTQLPISVDLRPNCQAVYDQGLLGSCTANAIAGAFEFDIVKQGLKDFIPSRLFIYYNERAMEGTIGQDAGAMIRDGMKTINQLGVCDEKKWPYAISKFARKPTKTDYTSALKHKCTSYKRVDRNLQSMQSCLAAGYPFVFGFSVYESFESEEVAKSGNLNMPDPKEQMLGGHAVMAVGYANGRFIVRNSWGKDWGQSGYFTIPFEYLLNSNLADDFWTLRIVE